MLNLIDFKVCVHCFTYNHAQYITDTLDGFTKQVTDFPFVCVILDDCSEDATASVLANYLDNYFSMVVEKKYCEDNDNYRLSFARHINNENCYFAVYYLKYNHYTAKKLKAPYFERWDNHSKYVAMCEGDDYWTDPEKLQKQVDILNSHPNVGLVHAKAKVYNQTSHSFRGYCGEPNGDFNQILLRNPIVTLTVCFRSVLSQQYTIEKSSWNTCEWKMGDYPMWLWMSQQADIHFLDEAVAVYRETVGSATHPSQLKDRISFIENTVSIQLFFSDLYKVPAVIKKRIVYNGQLKCATACFEYGEKELALKYLRHLSLNDSIRIIYRQLKK